MYKIGDTLVARLGIATEEAEPTVFSLKYFGSDLFEFLLFTTPVAPQTEGVRSEV